MTLEPKRDSFWTVLRTVLFTTVLVLPAAWSAATAPAPEEIEDVDITLAVEHELRLASGVPADPIDVETTLGVVTLAGQVDNLLAKDRAEKVASLVKGVRAVVNQIEVRPKARPDDEIRTDILEALARNAATDSWEISATVERGSATLTGRVDSWWEKRLAGKVAMSVRSVASVDNRVEVVHAADRPDFEIKGDVEAALAWESRIDDALVHVEVEDARVLLSGTVGSAFEKSLAETTAYVAGVERVDTSALEVEWWARDQMVRKDLLTASDDQEIRSAIEDALLFDPRVNSMTVDIAVDNGSVTLSGTVKSLGAKRAADESAGNTTGVWRVRNYLKVRPGERDDAEIADDVREALLADPYVDRFDIDVFVRSGTASLVGTVESRFERRHVEDLAAETRGVVAVKNLLDVSYEPDGTELSRSYDWWDSSPEPSYSLQPYPVVPLADWEIRHDIEQEFFWSPFIDASEIQVTVDDAVATLTGTVDSRLERRQAEKEAYQGGALDVDNDLEIRSISEPSES